MSCLLNHIVVCYQEKDCGRLCKTRDSRNKVSGPTVSLSDCSLVRLLYMCHGVFYKQLSAWMLHGILLDRHHEFFIHRTQVMPAVSTLQIEDDDLGLGGVTGRQLQQIQVGGKDTTG